MASAIKEALREGTHLRWVSSGAQLADGLTKSMDAHFLRETIRLWYYRFSDEAANLKERAKSKDRHRWLKNQQGNSGSKDSPAKSHDCILNLKNKVLTSVNMQSCDP